MKNGIGLAIGFSAWCVCAPLLVSVSDAQPVRLAAPVAASVSPIGGATWAVGPDGWTVFRGTPGTGTCGNAASTYTGTCVVYVANSGNDATCAAQPLPVTATPTRPCATTSKAQTLIRDRSPDWMLLKKGDTWTGGMNGTSGGWAKNGRSATEPMLISSYGTGARPLFKDGGLNTPCYSTTRTYGQFMAIVGIECYTDFADPESPSYRGATATGDISTTSATITNMNSTKGIEVGHVAYGSGINGLTVQSVTSNSVTLNGNPGFTSAQRTIQFNKRITGAGISMNGVTNFLIVEDCKLRFAGLGIINNAAAPVAGLNLRIRRNIILDAYNVGGHAQGMFLSDNQLPGGQILIEENLVDHAGHNPSIWGAGATVFNHNFYLHDHNPPISFIRNITANASATGAQVRNGGTIYNNLSLGNPIAIISHPGIQFNPTTYSYNVITAGSDIIVGRRSAIGATPAGDAVLKLDGVLTAGSLNFVGQRIANLDNPGSVTGGVVSVTAISATMSTKVAPGQRGDGVKAGDRLVIYAARAMGISVGPTGTLSPDTNKDGGTYPVGSTVFYFPKGYELPAWVVPGMNIAVYAKTAFAGGMTTIAAISADRLQLTTASPSTISILGGSVITGAEQSAFVIWKPGDESPFPKQTIGPNNIFTTSAALYAPSYAYSPQSYSRNISAAGNYFYNWNTSAKNIEDYGIPGANINVPSKLSVTGSTSYPNATIEAYDRSIGGPGTAAHFLAQARLQSKDRWDPRYTANAANNFIRDALGCNCAQ